MNLRLLLQLKKSQTQNSMYFITPLYKFSKQAKLINIKKQLMPLDTSMGSVTVTGTGTLELLRFLQYFIY